MINNIPMNNYFLLISPVNNNASRILISDKSVTGPDNIDLIIGNLFSDYYRDIGIHYNVLK